MYKYVYGSCTMHTMNKGEKEGEKKQILNDYDS